MESKGSSGNERTPRRTQAQRNAATRAALLAAARPLFGSRPYVDVSTQAVVEAAGVTRGALYHQFADKRGLFLGVFDEVHVEITDATAAVVAESGLVDPMDLMRLGVRAFLDAYVDPVAQRIVLLEAPSILGWAEWRERGAKHGMALVEGLLVAGVEAGAVRDQPVRPVAHVAIAAIDEAAMYIAGAQDQPRAREEMLVVLDQLIDAITAPPE